MQTVTKLKTGQSGRVVGVRGDPVKQVLTFARKHGSAYLFLMPTLVLMAVFMWYPLFNTFYASLYQWDGFAALSQSNFIGFKNYLDLLQDVNFLNAARNTILWMLMYVFNSTLFGLVLALVLDSRIKGEILFKVLIYLPGTIAMVLVGFIWTYVYFPSGPINQVLRLAGLGKLATAWLANKSTVLVAINIASTWVRTGFAMVIFLAGLKGIAPDLIEACKVDGGTRWQITRHVVLPLLRPAFTVVIGTSLMLSIAVFDEIAVMTQGGPGRASEVLSLFLYSKMFRDQLAGSASAIGIVMFVISAFAGMMYVRQMVKREVEQ
jgi:multiple sugar transport system permease protein/raffinose/stachyose/melibiose transport system permease protein